MENNFRCRFIGLAGVATAGKDTFFKLLSQRLDDVKRYALADKLKSELRGFVGHYYEVDIMSCDPKTKEKLRPLMVFHGLMMRDRTEGRYWIRCLTEKMEDDDPEGIVVITDIRFAEYGKNDEISWLKNKIGGKLVFINRHKIISGVKVYVDPPNLEETRNNDSLKKSADYIIDWPTMDGTEEEIEKQLAPYVDKFIEWYGKDV
jgi:hypothetical protein